MAGSLDSELTAHAAALRALARALVGAADADDVVQDAALAALQRPPQQAAGLRGWLLAIVRHRAGKHRRAQWRRQRHEAAAPAPEGAPTPFAAAAQREVVQRLDAELLALPEPYQATLLQRYFAGRTPREIAAAAGVPVATVKSRLQRGLLLLRERLAAAGDGRAWRPALAAAFGIPAGTAPVLAAAVMSTTAKLFTVAAALAVASVLWFRAPAPPTPPAASGGSVPLAAAAAPTDLPAPAEPAAAAERSLVPAAAATPVARIRGRCVDPAGAPLAGVRAELQGTDGSSAAAVAYRQQLADTPMFTTAAMTGADGRFAFAFAPSPAHTFELTLDAAGRPRMQGFWSRLEPDAVQDVGDIVLPTAAMLRGRVVDRDGLPVADVQLTLGSGYQTRPEDGQFDAAIYASVRTRDDGTFASEPAWPPGTYPLFVHGRRLLSADSFTVAPGASSIDLEVVVEAASRLPQIAGIVTDERDQPLARVRVQGRRLSTETGRDGRFSLVRTEDGPDSMQMEFTAAGFEWPHVQTARWGDTDLHVRLRRSLAVELRVLAADGGAPVERFAAYVVPQRGPDADHRSIDARARCSGLHPGGTVTIEGIERGEALVYVVPEDPALAPAALQRIAVADPGPARAEVRLPRAASRTLRLAHADGRPAAGSTVQLLEVLGALPDAKAKPLPIDQRFEYDEAAPLLRAEVATDARGEAQLRGPSGMRFSVLARGEHHLPIVAHDVALDDASPLCVTVQDGGSVRGRVAPLRLVQELRQQAGLPADGPLPDALRTPDLLYQLPRVSLRRGEPWPDEQFPADGQGTAGVLEADGSFALDGVPPGSWQAWFSIQRGGNQDNQVGSVTVLDGEPAQLDLDLSSWLTGELRGTALCNGVPLPIAEVYVGTTGRERDGTPFWYGTNTTTDGNGQFRLRLRQGLATLRLPRDRCELRAREHVLLPADGSVEQVFHVDSGRLRIAVAAGDGSAAAGIALHLLAADGSFRRALRPTDATGTVETEVEPGPWTLAVLPRSLQDRKAQAAVRRADPRSTDPFASLRLRLGEVQVPQGATVEAPLRLPPAFDR